MQKERRLKGMNAEDAYHTYMPCSPLVPKLKLRPQELNNRELPDSFPIPIPLLTFPGVGTIGPFSFQQFSEVHSSNSSTGHFFDKAISLTVLLYFQEKPTFTP